MYVTQQSVNGAALHGDVSNKRALVHFNSLYLVLPCLPLLLLTPVLLEYNHNYCQIIWPGRFNYFAPLCLLMQFSLFQASATGDVHYGSLLTFY